MAEPADNLGADAALIARLRDKYEFNNQAALDAADRIEALEAHIARIRDAYEKSLEGEGTTDPLLLAVEKAILNGANK